MVAMLPRGTDEDTAMGLAIRAALPTTELLSCIFHIWKNFWKHIRPLLLSRTLELFLD
jgi:hypothetical protein